MASRRDPREVRVELRARRREMSAWKKAASQSDMSLSEWIRHRCNVGDIEAVSSTPRLPRVKRRIESISLDTLKTDSSLAIAAARQRGGVRVVDGQGVELFRLTMPSEPLPE